MTTLELEPQDYEKTYLFKKLVGNEKVLAMTKLSKIDIYSFIVITLCTCGLAAPFLIRSLLDYKFSEFILTENRLAIKKGIINNNVYEILIPKIEAVNISQNLIGKIFNYGTISVIGSGGSVRSFNNIDNPYEFRKAIQAQIEKNI